MINQRELIAALQNGLPLVSRPYAEIARQINSTEDEVIQQIEKLQKQGDIRRMGIVVRHRQLGYVANAMVVWNIPDEIVDDMGQCFGQFDFVSLSYRRPRQLPDWPYNLFCMIHGKNRKEVLANLNILISSCNVSHIQHAVLFSTRCFKQRGAVYIHDQKQVISACK